MAFHALIGAGFLAATFLVRPFLPSNEVVDIDHICGRSNGTVSEQEEVNEVEDGIDLNQSIYRSQKQKRYNQYRL